MCRGGLFLLLFECICVVLMEIQMIESVEVEIQEIQEIRIEIQEMGMHYM